MNYYIFSPLAVVCALTTLYSAPSDKTKSTVADLYEEFLTEELPFESLTADWAASTESKEEMQDEKQEERLTSLEKEASFEESLQEADSLTATKETPSAHSEPAQEKTFITTEAEEHFFYDSDSGEFYKKTPSVNKKTAPKLSLSKSRPLADPMLLADNNPIQAPAAATEEKSSFLSIGGTYAYTHMKPHGNPSFHGNLGGVQGLYEYRPCNKLYGGLKLSWRQGETEASNATRFLIDVTAEERLGYTVAVDENRWLWTAFTGLGYRYLGHHLKQAGESLRFNYSEFYCPVALFTDYQIYPSFSMGIHATWMPQIFPTVTIVPLGGARWATSYQWGNILIEAPMTFFAGKNKQFFLTVNPTFQYWQDGHTTAKTSTGEALGVPGNTYFFWGADVNLGYAF